MQHCKGNMSQNWLKVAFVCFSVLALASEALQQQTLAEPVAVDAPQAPEIPWSTLTGDQLAQLAPDAFLSLNESTLESIPDAVRVVLDIFFSISSSCSNRAESHFSDINYIGNWLNFSSSTLQDSRGGLWRFS
jgi:hypothetical protein